MTDSTATTAYDIVPYPSVPFPQSHPNRLATVARLHGINPPAVETCRVLELGCAEGDNLIPLALQMPTAKFYGIDLSARQIEDGRTAIADLGLTNVQLDRLDILDFPESAGIFDYIIVHGVYSWVPGPIRDQIFAICKRHLRSNGIVFISYNVYPGWRLNGIVRDILRFHTQGIADPYRKIEQAQAMLNFLGQSIPESIRLYRSIFQKILAQSETFSSSAAWLFHDFLEDINEPVYFHQFVARAARHGLQFLAEADVTEMQTHGLSSQAVDVLNKLGDDILQREQYLDFLKNRVFRQTLLCHADVGLDRQLKPERLSPLYVAGYITDFDPNANPQSSELFKFRSGHGFEGATDCPLTKAALIHLTKHWPSVVSFAELQRTARNRLMPNALVLQSETEYIRDTATLQAELLQLYTAGFLELHSIPYQFTQAISERPTASPWARRQAEQGKVITNLRHEGVNVSEHNRHLICLLDGTRTLSQLLEDRLDYIGRNKLVILDKGQLLKEPGKISELLALRLEEDLQMLARAALLVG